MKSWRKKKQRGKKLDAITIDMVAAGEQQPESDHFVESENSSTGITADRHWRAARDWFSYKLSTKEQKALRLQVTYFGRDKDQQFQILVNDKALAVVSLDGSHGNKFFNEEYMLPVES